MSTVSEIKCKFQTEMALMVHGTFSSNKIYFVLIT